MSHVILVPGSTQFIRPSVICSFGILNGVIIDEFNRKCKGTLYPYPGVASLVGWQILTFLQCYIPLKSQKVSFLCYSSYGN